MIDLTSRQIQILRAVVEEYLSTAESVGSDTIDRKHNLGVSPATIRSEMVYLGEQGYLRQPHTSSGRVPTPAALRLYVRELMSKKDLSVADEVSVKERMWEAKHDFRQFLREAAKVLADHTQAIGIALTSDHQTYHSGYSYLLNMPEFADLDTVRTVLRLIEETNQLEAIFHRDWGNDDVHMIFGDDLGSGYLEPVSIVFTDISCANTQCTLGVIGSSRIDYSYTIPMLEYMNELFSQLSM